MEPTNLPQWQFQIAMLVGLLVFPLIWARGMRRYSPIQDLSQAYKALIIGFIVGAILASALDIYSDESTMKNENGDILDIRSDNEQVREVLHNLFYDVINIEFNLWPWIRSMNKYGDFFLKLDIAEKYGVVGVEPMFHMQFQEKKV